MSVISAVTIIGVEIKYDDLYEEKEVAGCDCKRTRENDKFCPECGRPLKTTKKVFKEALGNKDEFFHRCSRTPEGHRIFLCAWMLEGGPHVAFAPITFDFKECKQRLKKLLEPAGAWNESKFGVYSILKMH